MKNRIIYIATLLVALSFGVKAQSRLIAQDEIDRMIETPGMTVVYISPSMLKMAPVGSLSIDGNPAMKSVLKRVSSMYIFSAQDDSSIKKLRRTFSFLIDRKNKSLEQLMLVKEKDSVVRLLAHVQDDEANNLYLVVSDPKEFSVILLGGDFTRKELEKMFDKEHWNKK